jgi:hypothetical protein
VISFGPLVSEGAMAPADAVRPKRAKTANENLMAPVKGEKKTKVQAARFRTSSSHLHSNPRTSSNDGEVARVERKSSIDGCLGTRVSKTIQGSASGSRS